MRKNDRIDWVRLLAFFSIVALTSLSRPASGPLWAQDDAHARPDETIGELMSDSSVAAPAATPPGPGGRWGSAGIFILGAGLGFLLLLFWQRNRPASATGRGRRDVLNVVGRVTLSPKHSACLLKVGSDRLVVVALCGDAMSTLCTIEGESEISKMLGEIEKPAERAPWLAEEEEAEVTSHPSEGEAAPAGGFVSSLRSTFFPARSEAEE